MSSNSNNNNSNSNDDDHASDNSSNGSAVLIDYIPGKRSTYPTITIR